LPPPRRPIWLESRHYEDTNDPQVDGHFDAISSRITGTVTYINPKAENDQFLEAGTLLVELDPRDYQVELEHARATLDTRRAESHSAEVMVPIVNASAFSQLRESEAAKEQAIEAVSEAEANLTVAQHRLQQDQAQAERAERDRVRYLALVEKREISRSDYDSRATEATADEQAVEADQGAIRSAEQKMAEARSLVAQRDAQIAAARTAPQQLTDAQDKWHSANGGYVENMPGAAGPLFSLFPPENATGNYVKVVQRFPVRIRLNANEDPEHVLRPGMSVEPRVKVR
jgi:membrane fusion protein, multidrug efflux system